MIELKTPTEIEVMREAGRRLAHILEILSDEVCVGMTTNALDKRSHELILAAGCTPAFLGYRPHGAKKGYPKTLCTSVNDVVVHGVPSEYVLKDGDLLKLDLGLVFHKLYVDSAVTVPVGKVTHEVKKLIRVTRETLAQGIQEAYAGKTLGDIGYAIHARVSREKCAVVEGLTGHGIGRQLHEDPYVLNVGRRGEGKKLEVGMVLALEPMVSLGEGAIKQIKDESYATKDGSLAGHFEHTVAITKDGPRVLTRI